MFPLLTTNAVAVSDEQYEKESALNKIVNIACTAFDIPDEDDILERVIERESCLSTGIGLEVAVPHCRSSQVSHVVLAALLLRNAVDYNSVDGKPVKLIFLIISPLDDFTGHLESLSSISHAISDETLRSELLNSENADALFRKLRTIP